MNAITASLPLTVLRLIEAAKAISLVGENGWHRSVTDDPIASRAGGATLEKLLGIIENNRTTSDFADCEVKHSATNKRKKPPKSPVTLFNKNPRIARIESESEEAGVPFMLKNFGWMDSELSRRRNHPESTKYFYCTISPDSVNGRGLSYRVCEQEDLINISFSPELAAHKNPRWVSDLISNGIDGCTQLPAWKLSDVVRCAKDKLTNVAHFNALKLRTDGKQYFKYYELEVLINFNETKFISMLKSGDVFIDFRARNGHDHGTGFRIPPQKLNELYELSLKIPLSDL